MTEIILLAQRSEAGGFDFKQSGEESFGGGIDASPLEAH
jgi:hypothetical protein